MKKSIDGNTAASHVAYAFSEVCAIYPITPSSFMGELVDEWANNGRKNIFNKEVLVSEMQSEAGASGALHGALVTGAFCSTFTASQGLLLMIPNMYKISGELLPCVFHVSARSLARHALSIFSDHQDVMATRMTGFAHLASSSVQEVMDLALVCHLSTIRASVPFLHFFEGFRTSNEIQKIEIISYEDMKKLVDFEAVLKHRKRALNPLNPHVKGTSQNPDVYFQALEASNLYFENLIPIVEEEMDKVYKLTNRRYNLFDYVGKKDAERVIVIMGCGADTVEETVKYLNEKNEKVGVLKVRLFRPFSKKHFLSTLPKSVKKIAVLDRTKEYSAPLYLDVLDCLKDSKDKKIVVGGIYGIGAKEFTPNMVKSCFDNLKKENPKNNFTVGIKDDVTNRSLEILDNNVKTEEKKCIRCKFWGLGGDGTVGANKEAIKIIGDHTDKYVQGYFEFDAKKAFGLTLSNLRFGDFPIKSRYLIQEADYIACHQPIYVAKYDMLKDLREGGIFVLNSPWTIKEMEKTLPDKMKKQIAQKNILFYNIDGFLIAKELGLQARINTVMQAVFFKLIDILKIEDAVRYLKEAIETMYSKKGEEIVDKNKKAIDLGLENLKKIEVPLSWKDIEIKKFEEDKDIPDYIKNVKDVIDRKEGDSLPVSSFFPGGEAPLGTSQYEKRGFSANVPKWIPENCIQCNRCSIVCPHAVIRPFLMTEEESKKAPSGYNGIKAIGPGIQNLFFSIEVSSLDCTGCGNCVVECPAMKKALMLTNEKEIKNELAERFKYAISEISEKDEILKISKYTVKGSQFKKPFLEFSGACAGCGETPYVKLLTQLFGSRMIIANATGCSSIWGASFPSIPWAVNSKNCGPAWANSLFEDNAEFGFGMFLALKTRREGVKELIQKNISENKNDEYLNNLFRKWLECSDKKDECQEISYKIIDFMKKMGKKEKILEEIWQQKELLVKPSIWIIGGDGWAYDIGFGGIDHVLAMDEDVNILVLDTEVYSNTGGQSSKATPLGAIAKFASSGKKTFKKDLGMMAMVYENVYVASTSLGKDPSQVINAFKEADSYDGPSLVIGYSSCISHGIREGMIKSQEAEKKAVDTGYWINYRYDPRKEEGAKMQIDSKKPTFDIDGYFDSQVRFSYLKKKHPEKAKEFADKMKKFLEKRYQRLLDMK